MIRTHRFSMLSVFALAVAWTGCAASTDTGKGSTTSSTSEGLAVGDTVTTTIGVDGSCTSGDELQKTATSLCEGRGLSVSSLDRGAACDGGFVTASVTCIKPPPTPGVGPDPSGCFVGGLGAPDVCKPVEEWHDLASKICGDAGSGLAWQVFGEPCAPGVTHFTQFACGRPGCLLPPPPPPAMCRPIPLADPSAPPTCTPAPAWKDAGDAVCHHEGGVLAGLHLEGECGPGAFAGGAAICCPPPPMPEPLPPTCKHADLGDPSDPASCRPAPAWKDAIDKLCGFAGLAPVDFALGAPCGPDAFLAAGVTCCAPPPPAPPTGPEAIVVPHLDAEHRLDDGLAK